MKIDASFAVAALCVLCAACTPGAAGTPPPAGGSGSVIDVNLTQHAPTQTAAGESGGYAPAVTTVAVGSTIRFVNSDGFAHTATLIPGATTFPSGSPFAGSAQTQSGSVISAPWSSGTMQAGSGSQNIAIDRPGTYLFGCFFHYGAPMRGTIVAQ
ncbi:MAG TPA: plastocyanin/azurin family copper-binding protein [Candidatus Baltobacteraceae bacterium]